MQALSTCGLLFAQGCGHPWILDLQWIEFNSTRLNRISKFTSFLPSDWSSLPSKPQQGRMSPYIHIPPEEVPLAFKGSKYLVHRCSWMSRRASIAYPHPNPSHTMVLTTSKPFFWAEHLWYHDFSCFWVPLLSVTPSICTSHFPLFRCAFPVFRKATVNMRPSGSSSEWQNKTSTGSTEWRRLTI